MVAEATNRRFNVNKNIKHSKVATIGWYRYDTFFEMAVRGENEENLRWNKYRGTLIVIANEKGLFLYDLINIKKEASTPLEP